jgi:hypothetical protein
MARHFVQKKFAARRGALLALVALVGGGLLAAGCATSAAPRKGASRYRDLPVPAGVRISKQGEAVAELASQPDLLFEQAAQILRKDYRITFINSAIRLVEAEDRGWRAAVKVTPLLTGKTGVSVSVKRKADGEPDAAKAAEIAAALLPVGIRVHAPEMR